MGVYRVLARPLLFRADAEWVHDRAVRVAEAVGKVPAVCDAVAKHYGATDPRLAVEVAGMTMSSPIGLGAGFDKNGRAVAGLGALGFGHVEIGSVSVDRSDGNPRPRLFRLPSDEAIVVHYGVPNDGADAVAHRLHGRRNGVRLGINVVNTNRGIAASEHEVIDDYVRAVRRLQGHADYLCLNLSCPNTEDGQHFFLRRGRLELLLHALAEVGIERPVVLKVAPFARPAELDGFLTAVGGTEFVRGFSVNLPPGKPAGLAVPEKMPGAVSGRPAERAANRTIRELYAAVDRKRQVIVGSGGVFDADDAYRKIRLGASLVQLLTALVYRGPSVVREINRGLPELLSRDGFASVREAVGADVRT
ncbi:quinone-dependent dihydroorotate dehydrogenase [Kutzneria chonburiensis]|uniref:Dihydroorotate dehydrogenase (quinone) n=1 Tax=Kutzneria chonburiensis TaxID=1483604 RepID=A0ABV6N850_9PSEU|nr:quinone-dependent dihydroorotate dehydrogenase [Kutzneria chonburiensis]